MELREARGISVSRGCRVPLDRMESKVRRVSKVWMVSKGFKVQLDCRG